MQHLTTHKRPEIIAENGHHHPYDTHYTLDGARNYIRISTQPSQMDVSNLRDTSQLIRGQKQKQKMDIIIHMIPTTHWRGQKLKQNYHTTITDGCQQFEQHLTTHKMPETISENGHHHPYDTHYTLDGPETIAELTHNHPRWMSAT